MAKEVEITVKGKPYRPGPGQLAFHQSRAEAKAAVGPFGNGKSIAVGIEVLLHGLTRGRGRAIIGRYDWFQLENVTFPRFLDLIPPEIRYHPKSVELRSSGRQKFVTPTGYEFICYNLKKESKWRSDEVDCFWLEEANEDGIDEDIYLGALGRLRGGQGYKPVLISGNPAGRNWVYNRFFRHLLEPGAKKWPGHEGFWWPVEENIHLPEGYVERQLQNYTEEWRERYVNADLATMFSMFEGQILENFDANIHVIPAFHPPREFPRYRSLDPGFVHPTGALWGAADYDGNLYIYREYYQREEIPEAVAATLRALSAGETIEWTKIDPEARARETGTGIPLIQQYRAAGLECSEANNRVNDSIARLKSLLQPDPTHEFPRFHPKAGEKGSPHLFICDNCPWTKWELENWRWKDLKPGQTGRPKPVAKDDHLVACLRYMVMATPQKARPPETYDPFDLFQQIAADLDGQNEPGPDLYNPKDLIGAR